MKIALIRRSASATSKCSEAGLIACSVTSGLPAIRWSGSLHRLSEQKWQLAGPPYRTLRPSHGACRIEPEVRNPLQPFLQSDLHLHPRQVGTDAAMDPKAEGGVAVLAPIDHNLVSIRKHLRVAVGGREGQQHHVARFDRAAGDRGRL